MAKLTEAVFSMQCSFIAKNAAAWAGDILTLPEHYNREADPKTVGRFTDEIRARLDRLDDWAGRETSSPPGNQIRTAECDDKDALPVTGQLPVGTASTKFPPSCCTAWEDCDHDGVCHDPQYCGAVGPSALATTEGK